jgi:hypothetical protein
VVEMRGMAPYFPETADDGYARQGELPGVDCCIGISPGRRRQQENVRITVAFPSLLKTYPKPPRLIKRGTAFSEATLGSHASIHRKNQPIIGALSIKPVPRFVYCSNPIRCKRVTNRASIRKFA